MSVNNLHNVRTVRWDKDLIKRSLKRRGTNQRLHKCVKYTYGNLYDGVHPYINLSKLWFDVLCDSVVKDLPACDIVHEADVVCDSVVKVLPASDAVDEVEEDNDVIQVIEQIEVVEEFEEEKDAGLNERGEENESWDFKRVVKFCD